MCPNIACLKESGASGVSGAAAAAIVLKPIEYDVQDR